MGKLRIDSIDFLKGLAIIGVITLHSFRNYGVFEVLVMQSVPVFLILMGLNGALSLDRCGFNVPDYIRTRFLRLGLPLIPVFFVILALALLFNQPLYMLGAESLSPALILLGQMPINGPGNYFIGLIIQATILIPILWWLSKKDVRLMLGISFAVSLGYEIAYYFYLPHDSFIYELLIFRWLFAIAIGIALVDAVLTKKISFTWLAGISVSTGLVLFFGYSHLAVLPFGYSLINACTYLFPAGIIVAVIFAGVSWKPIDLLGKASYHIFLIQMIFFIGLSLGYLMNLGIIIAVGMAFYFVDSRVQIMLKNRSAEIKKIDNSNPSRL